MKRLGTSSDLDVACRAFRMWHQKEPNGVVPYDYPLEDYDVFCAGVADTILYASDKWERDGNVHDYIHEFDSHPTVWTTDGHGEEGNPADLMDVDEVSRNAEASLPILAAVKSLLVRREDGSKRDIRFRSPPMLLSTLDKKGLVILTEDVGPIYVRGGRMIVTARGIHH